MADGSIVIDTKIDEAGLKSGIASLTSKVTAGVAAISAALSAGTATVVKYGSEFESSVAKASTLFGDANVNINNLNNDILKLSDSTGVAASQFGSTLYNALSAGIPATDDMSEALGFLEKNAKLAKAGFTDIDTAMLATVSVLNGYQKDVSETADVQKMLMQIQNRGIATIGELGSVMSNVTPVAAANKVEFDQVSAALATMTNHKIPAAQATTQLRQMFVELGKSGTQAQKGLKEATKGTKYAGMSFQELMEKGVPLNEVLDLMDGYAKKNKKSLSDMFSSVEAGNAAISLSGKYSKQFTDNLKAMHTETDVVGEAYDKVTNTFEEQSKKALNSLKNLGIGIYNNIKEPLKDSVKNTSDGLDKLSKSFSGGKLKSSISDMGKQIGKVADTLLDFAIKAIPKVVEGFTWFLNNGKTVISVLVGLKAAQLAYNIAVKGTAIISVVVKAIQGAALGFKAYSTGLSFATSVQIGFNTALSGTQIAMGLATGGLTILAGALAMWGVSSLMAKDSVEETTSAVKEQREALEELGKATREQAESAALEYDLTSKYHEELKGMIDAEGNITGNKERAKYLIEQINKLLPNSIEYTKDEKVAYTESAKALEELIEKKRAEAVLEAHREEYKTAKQQEKELLDQLVESNKALEEQQKKVAEAEKRAIDTKETWQGAQRKAQQDLDAEIAKLKDLETVRDEAAENCRMNGEKVSNYQKLERAFTEGHYEEMNKILQMQPENIQFSNNMTMEKYNEHLTELEDYYLRVKLAHENNIEGYTEQMVKEAEQQVNNWRLHGEELIAVQNQNDTNMTDQMVENATVRNDTITQKHGEGAIQSTNAWNENYSSQEPVMENNMLSTLLSSSAGATLAQSLENVQSQGGAGAATDFSQGYTNKKSMLQNDMWSTLYNASIQAGNSPELAKANADNGIKAIQNVSEGVKEKENLIFTAILNGMKNGVIQVNSDGTLNYLERNTGESTVEGIGAGAQFKKGWLGRTLVGIVNAALAVTRQSQEVNSPSKKWKRMLGSPLAEGVGVGFEERMKAVTKSMKKALNNNLENVSRGATLNYKMEMAHSKGQQVVGNTDNRVTQNLHFYGSTNSPAETARKVRHAAQMLAYQR